MAWWRCWWMVWSSSCLRRWWGGGGGGFGPSAAVVGGREGGVCLCRIARRRGKWRLRCRWRRWTFGTRILWFVGRSKGLMLKEMNLILSLCSLHLLHHILIDFLVHPFLEYGIAY